MSSSLIRSARRHLLAASALTGAVAIFLPAAANAETARPAPTLATNLAAAPATATVRAAVAETGGFFNAKGVKTPVAVTVFPGEQYEAPRSSAERACPNLIHYHRADKGGRFAAWEHPTIFAEELRAAFRTLR